MAASVDRIIHAPDHLWYRLHVFIHDLYSFEDSEEARDRLDSLVDTSYIGAPYFSNNESRMLKGTVVDAETGQKLERIIRETLEAKPNRRARKNVNAQDYRVCAAHDLGPILAKAFGISEKDLNKDKDFQKLVANSGLEPETAQVFYGVGSSKFKPKLETKSEKSRRLSTVKESRSRFRNSNRNTGNSRQNRYDQWLDDTET